MSNDNVIKFPTKDNGDSKDIYELTFFYQNGQITTYMVGENVIAMLQDMTSGFTSEGLPSYIYFGTKDLYWICELTSGLRSIKIRHWGTDEEEEKD